MSDGQNKIYYDVNIPYRAEDKDEKFHHYSRAETEVRMNGPLISDPMNYDLAISKFKIDTECLPIYIPDMQQPQQDEPMDPLAELRARGELKSKSMVTIYYPTCTNGTRQWRPRANQAAAWVDVGAGHVIEYDINDYRFEEAAGINNNGFIYASRWKHVTFCPNEGFFDTTFERYREHNKLPTSSITVGGVIQDYVVNTNQAFFQYDYQSVLDRINVCMERLLQDVYMGDYNCQPYNFVPTDNLMRGIFFKVEDGLIVLYVDQQILEANIMFKFSPDLYKYIGNGFQCRFFNNDLNAVQDELGNNDGSFFIDYNPFAWRHLAIAGIDVNERIIVSDDDKWPTNRAHTRDIGTYLELGFGNLTRFSQTWDNEVCNRYYYTIKQQYSTLSNWNICKAILICSSSFPIKPEYYPSLKRNLYLTHYKDDNYVNDMRNVFKSNPYEDDTLVFDKSSTKILDVYYPVSTQGGDIRSCIIYSNDNIEAGNKIDMVGGMDLENFDIKVKWVDLYGNVYDLYLAPGCSVNIRMCFTRKKILKDELVMAFNRICESLEAISQHYIPQVDDNKTFELKKEPKRKRNKVDLPGLLENGLIMKP